MGGSKFRVICRLCCSNSNFNDYGCRVGAPWFVGNRAAFGFDAAKAGVWLNYAACSCIWPFAYNPLAFVAYFVGKFSPIAGGIAAGLILSGWYRLLDLADLSGQGLLA